MMKVLLHDTTNAFFTPGGKMVHAQKLQSHLALLGVDIQFSRWWDMSQGDCDLIHTLSADLGFASQARRAGKKVMLSMIFDNEANKTRPEQAKAILKNNLKDMLPRFLRRPQYWDALHLFDMIHFMNEADRTAAFRYFPFLRHQRTCVIPHAFEPNEIDETEGMDFKDYRLAKGLPDKYLVSCANISERKRSVMLAQCAKAANVPVVFIGGGGLNSTCMAEFMSEIDQRNTFYFGYVSSAEKHMLERNAAGYVLFSTAESGCIAVFEAAAHNLPLLLPDLPWAHAYENPRHITYCASHDTKAMIRQLRDFYASAERCPEPSFKIRTWNEVAGLYAKCYASILGST